MTKQNWYTKYISHKTTIMNSWTLSKTKIPITIVKAQMPSNPNQKSRTRDNNPIQQLYDARAGQLGELGLPGCDEALSGMGGASLTNEVPGIM